jgi:hypothetical protein
MIDSQSLRNEVAAKLDAAATTIPSLAAFVGLDGFVDEILHVVDKRYTANRFDRVPTIAKYAERLAAAAGKSTNIELVSAMTKLGGNGPIMANALATFGIKVSYLGCLGWPALHPVFEAFSKRAEVATICAPGLTDAVEFDDGKVMMGKHYTLKEVNWENITARFGVDRLTAKIACSQLVGFVNWTMLPFMSSIWERIQAEVVPQLTGRRRLFFDLCDPEKRLPDDISHALELIVRFQDKFDVTLGLNEKEAYEVARVLGLDPSPRDPEGLLALTKEIHLRVPVDTIVVHPVTYALAVRGAENAVVRGSVCPKPKITTGAGDHFNSGFCLGQLLGFDLASSLLCGVSTSGHYVRTAESPTPPTLAQHLRAWPVN